MLILYLWYVHKVVLNYKQSSKGCNVSILFLIVVRLLMLWCLQNKPLIWEKSCSLTKKSTCLLSIEGLQGHETATQEPNCIYLPCDNESCAWSSSCWMKCSSSSVTPRAFAAGALAMGSVCPSKSDVTWIAEVDFLQSSCFWISIYLLTKSSEKSHVQFI